MLPGVREEVFLGTPVTAYTLDTSDVRSVLDEIGAHFSGALRQQIEGWLRLCASDPQKYQSKARATFQYMPRFRRLFEHDGKRYIFSASFLYDEELKVIRVRCIYWEVV